MLKKTPLSINNRKEWPNEPLPALCLTRRIQLLEQLYWQYDEDELPFVSVIFLHCSSSLGGNEHKYEQAVTKAQKNGFTETFSTAVTLIICENSSKSVRCQTFFAAASFHLLS